MISSMMQLCKKVSFKLLLSLTCHKTRKYKRKHNMKRKSFLLLVLIIVSALLILHLFWSLRFFSSSTSTDHHHQSPHRKRQNSNVIVIHPSDNNNNKNDEGKDQDHVQKRKNHNKLIHLPPEDRDSVIRWIPRVNGAVYADAMFDPEVLAGEGGAGTGGGGTKGINSESDPHHSARRPGDRAQYFNQKQQQIVSSCYWKTSVSSSSSNAKTNFRICAAPHYRHDHLSGSRKRLPTSSATLALLHEIEKIGIIDALQSDLDFERQSLHENSHQQHDFDTSSSSSSTSTNDQLLLTASVFGSSRAHFEFVYEYNQVDFADELCDFVFDVSSSTTTILGGGLKPDGETISENKESTASHLFEDETFSLSILSSTDEPVKIIADSVQGFHHAIRTFFLHAKENGELIVTVHDHDEQRKKKNNNNNNNNNNVERKQSQQQHFAVPCLQIFEDTPAMGWRSQHIDIARHFFSAETLLHSVVRPMAWSKMNVLHLHLSDDQGWRVESGIFPSLHLFGGRRTKTLNGKSGRNSKKFVNSLSYDQHSTGSQFWSVEDIWMFVQECRARGIRVMPEIDLPSHATAVLLALEVEVLRFAASTSSLSSNLWSAFVRSELRHRFQNRLKMRDRSLLKKHNNQGFAEHLFGSDHHHDQQENENEDSAKKHTKSTSMFESILDEGIPSAAKAIDQAVKVFRDPTMNTAVTASLLDDPKKLWRRSFFGTFYHANSDCSAAHHFEAPLGKMYEQLFGNNKNDNSSLSLVDHFLKIHYQHHFKNPNRKSNNQNEKPSSADNHHPENEEEPLSDEWSSQEFFEKFFSASSYDKMSDDISKYETILDFIQSHSAVNCMGGTHGIVDPSQAAADVLTLILSEVAFTFHIPLEYSYSKYANDHRHNIKKKNDQNKNEENKNDDNQQNNKNHNRPSYASNTFGPTNLFHVGGDQAAFLRDFGWAPWTLSSSSSSGDVIQVNGDEENDQNARQKQQEQQQANTKINNKGTKSGLDIKTQQMIATAFPVLALPSKSDQNSKSTSSSSSPSLQSRLTSHFITKLQDYSSGGNSEEEDTNNHRAIRSAVWDETLLELHDDDCLPPPRGTIITFWRDDGIPWQSLSDIIVFMWQKDQKKKNKKKSSSSASSFPPSDYYPLVFGGKTRLYFDYAQFPGGVSGNKYWPLNTFGGWIPFKASTLERVFLVPELFPPQFLATCSPIYQAEQERSSSSSKTIQQRMFSYFSKQTLPGFRLIGVQGHLWSELLIKEEILRYQLFPRMFAVAEVGWSLCLSGVVPTVRMHLMKMQVNNDPVSGNQQHGKHEEEENRNNKDNHHFSCAMNHWMASSRMRSEHNQKVVIPEREQNSINNQHLQHQQESDDLLPVQEMRCDSFDVTSKPIMTSCIKDNKRKNKNTNGKRKIHQQPVFFTIWESKLMCSAQYEESAYF